MSSPPTSGISTRNALLHQHQRRFDLRSSSLGGLNPFHKKLNPRAPEPIEPYEIAPGTGILNTDATAKVFGYLDREEHDKREAEKRRKKARRKKADKHNQSRSHSPVKRLRDRYKEVHADDGTDDFRRRTHRQHVEAQVRAVQEQRVEAHRIWEEGLARSKRGRMVSEDDKLPIRGANPRTGIVTPYVASERNSSDSGYGTDYLRVQPQHGPMFNQGTWRQTEQGWSVVEDQESHVRSQQHHQQEKMVAAEDRVAKEEILMRPAIDNEQILRYHRSLRKAYRQASDGKVFVDPNAPPSPRIRTPTGPSSPPPTVIKIPRKKVGSGAKNREESDDTVIFNGKLRAASVSRPSEYPQLRHRVRVVSPQSDAKRFKQSHMHVHNSRSFLGHPPGTRLNPCLSRSHAHANGGLVGAKTIPNWSLYPNEIVYQHPENPRSLDHFRSATVARHTPAIVPSLRAHLPTLRFPHPSQFSNRTPSYRRSPNPEAQGMHRSAQGQGAMGAHTTTTTTIPPSQSQRKPPLVRRPALETNSNLVSQGRSQSAEQSHLTCENPHQTYWSINLQETFTNQCTTTNSQTGADADQIAAYVARHKTPQNHPPSPQNDTENCRQMFQSLNHPSVAPVSLEQYQANLSPTRYVLKFRDQHPTNLTPPTINAQTRSCSEIYTGWVTTDAQLEPPVSNTSSTRKPNENVTPGPTRTEVRREGLRLRSGNIATAERGRARTKNGNGCIPTYASDENTGVSLGTRACQVQPLSIQKKSARFAECPRQSSMVCDADGGVCTIERTDSLRRRVEDLNALFQGIDFHFHLDPYAAGRQALRLLVIMVHHVVMTFHPSSKALHVLRVEGTGGEGYWVAACEVLRAVVYFLVLAHFGLVGWRVGRVVWSLGGVVAGPIKWIWGALRWMVVG